MTKLENSETVKLEENNDKWALWQWLVVIFLAMAIFTTLYLKFNPRQATSLPPNAGNVTLDQEIAGYRKQLAGFKDNYMVLSKIAEAYVRKARETGDPAWYILAEQNARASLTSEPVDNFRSLYVLAKVDMARHEFKQAIVLADTLAKEPKLIVDAVGIMFDAHMATGEFDKAKADLEKIRVARENVFFIENPKLKSTVKTIAPDGITLTRDALLAAATGKDKDAENYFKKAIVALTYEQGEPKAWVYSLYATFLIVHGRFKEAEENIKFSLNNVADYVPALVDKAEIARENEKWQDVLDSLTEVNKKLLRSDILLRMAEAEKKLGKTEEYNQSVDTAEKILKQEESSGSFGHQRDYIRLLLDRNTPEALKLASVKAEGEIKLRGDLDTFLITAETDYLNKDLGKMREVLAKAAKTGVNNARLFFWLARLADAENNLTAAKTDYQKALDFNPYFDPEEVKIARAFIDSHKGN